MELLIFHHRRYARGLSGILPMPPSDSKNSSCSASSFVIAAFRWVARASRVRVACWLRRPRRNQLLLTGLFEKASAAEVKSASRSSSLSRDATTNTRDACATQSSCVPLDAHRLFPVGSKRIAEKNLEIVTAD
jgi:hypothetical protein